MSRTYTATEERPTRTLIPAHDAEIFTIDELIRRRAIELGNSPLIGYPKEGVTDYEDHSAFAVDKYADAAAAALQQKGLEKVVSTRCALANFKLTPSSGSITRKSPCRWSPCTLRTAFYHHIAGFKQTRLRQPAAVNPSGSSSFGPFAGAS